MARLQMQELPKSQMTTIMASVNRTIIRMIGHQAAATFQGCQDNNEEQQRMVDLYRALVTKGFLSIPSSQN